MTIYANTKLCYIDETAGAYEETGALAVPLDKAKRRSLITSGAFYNGYG